MAQVNTKSGKALAWIPVTLLGVFIVHSFSAGR